jgi:hypothetical protein
MDERRRRAVVGWIGGSIAFPLAWFFFTRFVENEPADYALRTALMTGIPWSIVMFIMMVVLPRKRAKPQSTERDT